MIIGPTNLTPDLWRGEREEVAKLPEERLIQRLAGYKPGSEPYLIVQAEIERRKQAARDAREDERFRKTEFRSWVAVAVSVLAVVISLAALLYKK